MAQHAPFLAALGPPGRDAVFTHALRALGDGWPVLERPILVITAVV